MSPPGGRGGSHPSPMVAARRATTQHLCAAVGPARSAPTPRQEWGLCGILTLLTPATHDDPAPAAPSPAGGWQGRRPGDARARRPEQAVPAPAPGLEPVQHAAAAPGHAQREPRTLPCLLLSRYRRHPVPTPVTPQHRLAEARASHTPRNRHAQARPAPKPPSPATPPPPPAARRSTWHAARPWAAAAAPMPRCTSAAPPRTTTLGTWMAGAPRTCCPASWRQSATAASVGGVRCLAAVRRAGSAPARPLPLAVPFRCLPSCAAHGLPLLPPAPPARPLRSRRSVPRHLWGHARGVAPL